jgi:DNA gyrase subunit A
MRVTEARGRVIAAFTVAPADEILLFSSAGNLVRTATDEISEQGRDATGVRVARVGEGDTVVAVARVLEAENGNGDVADSPDGESPDASDPSDPVEEA